MGDAAIFPEIRKRLVREEDDVASRPGVRRKVVPNLELVSSSAEVDGDQPRRQP